MQTLTKKQPATILNREALDDKKTLSKNLLFYFVLAYAVQGVCQHFCLIAQPLDFYLMQTCHLNAAQVSTFLAALMTPWIIKPIYGCLSDLLPLWNYRSKSYLTLAYALAFFGFSGLAVLCFFGATQSANIHPALLPFILITSVGMAVGTTLSCGLTVKVGNAAGETKHILSIQAASYYSLNIISMLLGGWLCQKFGPPYALPAAALIAALPCLAAAISSWKMIDENPSVTSQSETSEILAALKNMLSDKRVWLAGILICCWNFSPGLTTPLYFYESNKLHFTQSFIGTLAAVNAGGMFAGAFLFRLFEKRFAWEHVLYGSILFSAAASISFIFLNSPSSAIILEIMRGISMMFACLSVYGTIASFCRPGIESSTTALLISVYNIAGQAGNVLGGNLYNSYCQHNLTSLLAVSAFTTLLCLPLAAKVLKLRPE